MRVRNPFHLSMGKDQTPVFRKLVLEENIRRAKIFAKTVILFEVILESVDIITCVLKVDRRFRFNSYFFLYLLMILMNVLLILLFDGIGKSRLGGGTKQKILGVALLSYVTLIMAWGSAITLLDQKLYGQLMAFMVNMIACSVVFYFDWKTMVAVSFPAVALLYAGLPFFQKSSDILIGHYVNGSVFVLISWLSSRILYNSFVSQFKSSELLKLSNEKLHQISFADELTGVPNRRSYSIFIRKFEHPAGGKPELYSALMIDIDDFKIYNDTYGHSAGDEALTAVAQKILAVAKEKNGFIARIGGEEFVVIAKDAGRQKAEEFAEQIRAGVEQMKIPFHTPGREYLTISVGAAALPVHTSDDMLACVILSDKALYRAKKEGKNRVGSCFGEEASGGLQKPF